MTYGYDRLNALVRSQQLRSSALGQNNKHSSMEQGGAHEPPAIDCCRLLGEGGLVLFKDMTLDRFTCFSGWPHINECMRSTKGTQGAIKMKENMKLGVDLRSWG